MSNQDRYKLVIRNIPQELLDIEDQELFVRFKTSKYKPLVKLKKLFDFVDEIFSYILPFTPCKKGCSNCCNIPVAMTALEAEYISINEKIKPRNPNKNKRKNYSVSCPFLVGGCCSIYKSRPYVCRKFCTIDANFNSCNLGICSSSEYKGIRFSEIDKSFEHIVTTRNSLILYDIRQFFGV